jgi:cell division septation protein DedD
VADVTHDASNDGFHEIQLSGKQLVFLFMATTVVSVVIFLCGVLVGRGVRAERGAEVPEPTLAGAPAPTDTLAEANPSAADAPTPPAETTEAPPPVVDEAPADRSEPTPEPSKPADEPATSADAAATSAPPVPEPVPPPAPAPVKPQESGPRERASKPSPAPRGTWVVQIVALRDRAMASSIVQRLSGKGYPAFVVNPTAGTPAPVFKVQVGRYAEREEAEQIARRLEKEEQFKPWVSR